MTKETPKRRTSDYKRRKVDKVVNGLSKENIVIVAATIFALVQMNLFATKLDLAQLKLDILELQDSKVGVVSKEVQAMDKKITKILIKLGIEPKEE